MKPYIPKDLPPEKINRSNEQPLFNFFSTLFMVTGLLISIYLFLLVLGFALSKTVSMQAEYSIFNKKLSNIFISKSDKKTTEELNLEEPLLVERKKSNIIKLTNDLWQQTMGSNDFNFTPQLMHSDMPNAFITPGAHIFVTNNLIDESLSENELSFVLCHELGHFYNRDTIRLLGGQLFIGFFHILMGSSSLPSGLPSITQMFIASSFSREQESEADKFALHCMNKKYGHVNGYSHFFDKIKNLDKKTSSKYFSTHPLTEDRLKSLQKIIADKKYQINKVLSPLPWAETKNIESN